MAAVGRLPGRLGAGELVASVPTGVYPVPYVAMAGNGIAYVVWQADPRGGWVVAVARGDRFSAPRPLGIPADAQLQELAGAGGGPVAAVWLQYGVHSAPAYRYALLRRDGRVGRTITIGRLGSPLQSVEFAINDHAAVAASWVNSGKPFGAYPRVSAGLCTRAGRCSRRETIRFQRPIGQNVTLAGTLSDGGTATIVAASNTSPEGHGYTYGLQAAVSRHGGVFTGAGSVAPEAGREVTTTLAAGQVVALFTGAITAAAWTELTSHGFTRPRILDHRASGPLIAKGSPKGDLILAWIHSPAGIVTDTSYSIRASLGTTHSLPAPQTIAPRSSHIAPGDLAGGIDGRGDAIAVWDEFIDSQSRGVFASIGHS